MLRGRLLLRLAACASTGLVVPSVCHASSGPASFSPSPTSTHAGASDAAVGKGKVPSRLSPGALDVLTRATAMPPPSNAEDVRTLLRQIRPSVDEPLRNFAEAVELLDCPDFYTRVFPDILRRAAQFNVLFPAGCPLLLAGQRGVASLSRDQVACLLANMLLCTFRTEGSDSATHRAATDMPYPVFDRMLTVADRPNVPHKLACFLHFFDRLSKEDGSSGAVIFRRTVMPPPPSASFWLSSSAPMCRVDLVSKGGIEDAKGCMQVDFANKFIGGGVLGAGCVQEEILMGLCPELTVSLLLYPVLLDNEAALITGAERFSNYSGYASSFRYGGDHVDDTLEVRSTTGVLKKGTVLRRVIAIDATPYGGEEDAYATQLRPDALMRELNKAYCGFGEDCREARLAVTPVIATGNWGCGVFGGDVATKAVLQWLAASQSGRRLRYYTFGNRVLDAAFRDLVRDATAANLTVGDVFTALNIISRHHADSTTPDNFLPLLRRLLRL